MPAIVRNLTPFPTKQIVALCLAALLVSLTACSSSSSDETQTDDTQTPAAEISAASTQAVVAEAAASAAVPTVDVASVEIVEVDPYPLDQTVGPVRIQIPEIGLDAPIIAMGWRVDVADGKRTTVWDVPLDKAGWHINSAGVGGMGNTIVSGRQADGAAVFAPLALGSFAPGQEVFLTDGDGITFVYRITEVTDPIPVVGATPDEIARAATFFEPTTSARLTLVTGWPDFTTTHRIFAVAEFLGVVPEQ